MSPRHPRRILFVTHAFLPDSHAGIELYALRLARGFAARGHTVAVVTSRLRPGAAQNSVEQTEVDGIPVFGIVQNWPYRDLPEAANDRSIDRVFDGLLEELRPDLVAVQTLAHLSLGIPGRARSRGIPVVLHLHDGWWSCPSGGQRLHPDGTLCGPVDKRRCGACFDRYRHREGPLERAGRWLADRMPGTVPPDAVHRVFGGLPNGAKGLLRRLNEQGARLAEGRARGGLSHDDGGGEPTETEVDPRIERRDAEVARCMRDFAAVISPTRFLADSMLQEGLALPDLQVIPTGVPLPPDGATAATGPDPSGPLQVLFVGTWVRHKGPQVLARALAMVSGDVEARAVGPEPFPQFKVDVEAASGGRLRCAPGVPPRDVPALLDSADVVVVPSIWAENAPLVVLEARARRRPIVASRLGGLRELIVEGVDGRLFEPGDAVELAAILSRPDDLRGMRSTVQPPPSLDHWVDAVAARYEEVLAR